MHVLKRSTAGTYKPSVFSLMIDAGDLVTTDKKLNGNYTTVFFHEYVHFLQDILTSYGLHNIIQLAHEYSVINHEIINAASPTFAIPYVSANAALLQGRELNGLFWPTVYIPTHRDHPFS